MPTRENSTVLKWARLYNVGKSLRDLEKQSSVGREAIRVTLADVIELRPRGGPNAGMFRTRDSRTSGIPLKDMSVQERVDSLDWVNGPTHELLYVLHVAGDAKPGVCVADLLGEVARANWTMIKNTFVALERRGFAVGEIFKDRAGQRRFYSITADGKRAVRLLGLTRHGPTKSARTTPRQGNLESRPRRPKQGRFSVGDGRPRLEPLVTMTLTKRIQSMSLVKTPVWEVLSVLYETRKERGPGRFTGDIARELATVEPWHSVDNACKALAKRGFVERQPVEIPTGYTKTATKITGDGIEALRRARTQRKRNVT